MSKFLYGAAVQGIQGFIFQTNRLKDVIGASDLVAKICTTMFADLLGESAFAGANPRAELIVRAAGNIKCLFHDEELCKIAVREFPRRVMLAAPGVTISQAVVTMEQDTGFAAAVEELERKLRVQRNIPAPSLTVGLTGIERSTATGLPAVTTDSDGRAIDEGTSKKRSAQTKQDLILCRKSFGDEVMAKQVPYELSHVTDKNDWIAIIHADGNGLGKVVEKKGHDRAGLRKFSADLDDATKQAARKTFETVRQTFDIKGKIPLRPIVLGGDDMTIICRADIAFLYASEFLKNFEAETAQKGLALTACAGIAFIKSKFPFFYGYQLAESLCEQAKKDARQQGSDSPSCLLMHKVQGAFFDNWDTIVRQELTLPRGRSFEFGPYYLRKDIADRWDVDKLQQAVVSLSANNNIKNDLRNWASMVFENPAKAEQITARTRSLIDDDRKLQPEEKATLTKLVRDITKGTKRDDRTCFPVNDILTLLTVFNQHTKNKK